MKYFAAAFIATLGLAAAAAGGYKIAPGAPTAKPAAPLVSDEQRVRIDGGLYSLLESNDPAALADFPSPLFCYRHAKQPRGTACVYGVTYSDESTRRYTIILARNNSQLSWRRTALHAPKIPAA